MSNNSNDSITNNEAAKLELQAIPVEVENLAGKWYQADIVTRLLSDVNLKFSASDNSPMLLVNDASAFKTKEGNHQIGSEILSVLRDVCDTKTKTDEGLIKNDFYRIYVPKKSLEDLSDGAGSLISELKTKGVVLQDLDEYKKTIESMVAQKREEPAELAGFFDGDSIDPRINTIIKLASLLSSDQDVNGLVENYINFIGTKHDIDQEFKRVIELHNKLKESAKVLGYVRFTPSANDATPGSHSQHYVGFHLFTDSQGRESVLLFDPFGGIVSQSVLDVFKESGYNVYFSRDKIQQDGNSCGPITIEVMRWLSDPANKEDFLAKINKLEGKSTNGGTAITLKNILPESLSNDLSQSNTPNIRDMHQKMLEADKAENGLMSGYLMSHNIFVTDLFREGPDQYVQKWSSAVDTIEHDQKERYIKDVTAVRSKCLKHANHNMVSLQKAQIFAMAMVGCFEKRIALDSAESYVEDLLKENGISCADVQGEFTNFVKNIEVDGGTSSISDLVVVSKELLYDMKKSSSSSTSLNRSVVVSPYLKEIEGQLEAIREQYFQKRNQLQNKHHAFMALENRAPPSGVIIGCRAEAAAKSLTSPQLGQGMSC